MSEETDKIYARLAAQEREIANLREGYVIINRRYSVALGSLKLLTANATETMKRAAIAADKAATTAAQAAAVAREAVSKTVADAAAVVAAAADAAAAISKVAATAAAEAAAEAVAAAAAAGAAAAAAAVATEAEHDAAETSLRTLADRATEADGIANAASPSSSTPRK